MPRQGDGSYVAPSGVNEIVPGATADADDVRLGLLDLGNEMTNSIAADGQTPMSGQLVLAAGSSPGAPAAIFDDDRDSGLYWSGTQVGIAVNATASALFGDADIALLFPTKISGDTTLVGDVAIRNDGDSATTISFGNAQGTANFSGNVIANAYTDANGSLPFPSGTRMAFQQTSAPLGWTKETSTTYDSAFFRMTTGTASTGGSRQFAPGGFQITNAAEMPTHNHALLDVTGTTSQDGNHQHFTTAGTSIGRTAGGAATPSYNVNNLTQFAGLHTHTVTLNSGLTNNAGSSNAIPLKYADFIIATKD